MLASQGKVDQGPRPWPRSLLILLLLMRLSDALLILVSIMPILKGMTKWLLLLASFLLVPPLLYSTFYHLLWAIPPTSTMALNNLITISSPHLNQKRPKILPELLDSCLLHFHGMLQCFILAWVLVNLHLQVLALGLEKELGLDQVLDLTLHAVIFLSKFLCSFSHMFLSFAVIWKFFE